MLSLFRIEYEAPGRYSMFPRWEQARGGILQNMRVHRNYYHTAVKHANAENIIVRLVNSLGIVANQPTENVYRNIVSKTNNIVRTMGLTSSVSKGSIFRNHFFRNSAELVIGHAGISNVGGSWGDWKNMRPLRVLTHPFTDLWGNVPDGKPDAKGEVSVFSIDIPMLAAMYSCFLKEQELFVSQGYPAKTSAQFVYAYVLGNTFEDMVDLAVFNRMNCRLTGTPKNDSPSNHPMALVRWADAVDHGIEYQLDALTRLQRRLPNVLDQTKLIFSPSLADLAVLPPIAQTIQCYWALTISRLKIISFGFRTMGNPKEMDNQSIARVQWSIDLHRTPNVIRNNLPTDMYVQVLPDLNYIVGL